jgi:penicillin amidase
MSPQNMVYADAHGDVAYRTIGMLVKRQPGTGNFPNDGRRVRRNWSGPVAAAENPSILNSDRGFIITANNRVCADFPYDMNGTFAPRYRYEAIERMLAGKTDIDMAYAERMQCDTRSVLAARMIPLVEKYVPGDGSPLARQARDMLLQWDGDVRVDRPEPSIYNTWLLRFMYQTYVDELGEELAEAYVSQRYVSLERFLMLLEADSPFFDDTRTAQRESVREIAQRAFQEALALLHAHTGSERISDWHWGRVHTLRFDHFMGRSKLLAPIVNRGPLPVAGDCETNLRAHFFEIAPPYTAELAAGLRLIVSFSPEPRGRLVLITGQNEFFLSPHYTDLTELWMKGDYFSPEEEPVVWTTAMVPK